MSEGVQTRRWTRAEYDRLIEIGVFQPGDRVELLGGELIVAEPQSEPHYTAIGLTEEALRTALGAGWVESRALERRRYVSGRTLMFGAAGVASGHRVVRECFDVRPPPLLIRMERDGGKREEQCSHSNSMTHAFRIPDRGTMRSLSAVVDLRMLAL